MALLNLTEISDREFERLVIAERPRLVRIAARIVGQGDAEDVCQEALLRALNARERFRNGSSGGWFVRITLNCAYDVLRQRARRKHASAKIVPLNQSIVNPTASLEIEEVFEQMPERLGEPLLMFALGYTYRETATLLGIPLGTVMSRIHRARRRAAATGLARAFLLPKENTPTAGCFLLTPPGFGHDSSRFSSHLPAHCVGAHPWVFRSAVNERADIGKPVIMLSGDKQLSPSCILTPPGFGHE